jgi:phosphoglycolate phosphatase-like HAD superfamily hydrolase
MPPEHETVFLFDVDDTLFDNDRLKADLGREVQEAFGLAAAERFWAIYEEQRAKHNYADFLGTLERFRLEHFGEVRALALSTWLFGYPFASRLFPDALAVVRHVSQWGLPVILTDGDGVFQPYKLERSGLWKAFDGRVLDYIHKEQKLGAVQQAYPARHYVVIDDKPSVLDAIKTAWGGHVTTVFVRQGHYARDAKAAAAGPPPDITLERIAELMTQKFSALAPV